MAARHARSQSTSLPPLPMEASPYSPLWNNSIALCATMKDEPLSDLREWLRYYRWLGFDHVYLTDNGSAQQADLLAALHAEFPTSWLTLRTEPPPIAQMRVYQWCAANVRAAHNWIAFFDADEFLLVRTADSSGDRVPLKAFLDGYRHTAGLAVHWINFGPDGQDRRPPGGGVLRHYASCDPTPSQYLKTIANTFWLDGVGWHPHNFWFRHGMVPIDERGYPLRNVWHTQSWQRMPEICSRYGTGTTPRTAELYRDCDAWHAAAGRGAPPEYRECCLLEPAMVDKVLKSADSIALFHYFTKSKEDWEVKMARGKRSWDHFNAAVKKSRDAPVCHEAEGIWELCCSPSTLSQDD